MKRLSAAAARRIALAAQGFADKRPPSPSPSAVTVRHLRRVLDRMAVLQLDSVNVLCRSHYLPVLARLGPYDRAKLDTLLYRSGDYFEYLAHEASLTAQELHPLLRWRMQSIRWRQLQQLQAEQPGYVQAVYDEVKAHGPLSVSELSDPGERNGPWWGLSKGKLALECLYVTGRLAIRERTTAFVTVYDIPERVIRPEILEAQSIDTDDAQRELLLIAARSHGVGTAADLADYFRLKTQIARRLLAELVEDERLQVVEVDGWREPAFLHPGAQRPRRITGRALLTPFDPIVWFRARAERLFGFHYRIEIYTPGPKRVYGYYVLPFLLDDELVGRVDLKADRKANALLVRGSYTEAGADPGRVAPALAGALVEMAGWLGLDAIDVADRGNLAPALRSEVRSAGVTG